MQSIRRFIGPLPHVLLAFVPFAAVVVVAVCPVDVRVQTGIFAGIVTDLCGAVQALSWLMPPSEQDAEEHSDAWPLGVEMPPIMRRSFASDLASYNCDRRRGAIQAFANCGSSPVAAIACWPEQQCSNMQLA